MPVIIYFAAAFLFTYFGILFFRRWSLRRNLLDVPNERSSHSQPTPRGGGLIIAFVCLVLFFIYLAASGNRIFWAYFAGALIVAVISWIDDLQTISAAWRFICHSLAAVLAIWFLGCFESVYIPLLGTITLGKFGCFITFIWIVWLINAYNFMDGIDGIAGAQALTAGIGWLLIGYLLGHDVFLVFGGVIASSSLGFLIHNWQPAKIFMGDVGSAFLGFTFAVMPLLFQTESEISKNVLPVAAIALVWLFMFDSVYTLLKRLIRGEKVWQAHRQHIYQSLIISGLSHQRVTLLYLVISAIIVSLVTFWVISGTKAEGFLSIMIFFFSGGILIYGHHRKKLT